LEDRGRLEDDAALVHVGGSPATAFSQTMAS
jgi:hypothetical protein